jgi:hypothetical protein
MRHMSKRRRYARARPQIGQRFILREENFGVFPILIFWQSLDTVLSPLFIDPRGLEISPVGQF